MIYVDKSYMKNNLKKLLRVGDIIISSANSKELVGKSCLVESLNGEMTFGGFVLVIRTIEVNPSYLHLYLRNLFLKGAFYKKSTQTTNIANISTRDLESLEICLPPLNEQAKIVQKVNDIINILEKSLS
jgi:type I restriction enzyme S subunit